MPGGLVVTRSLSHELQFRCFDDATLDVLRFIETRPRMPSTQLVAMEIRVERMGDAYRLCGENVDMVCPADGLLDQCHRIIRDVLVDETREGLLLHAGSLEVDGQTILLIGDKGAGKTTLTLKALASGIKVLGDEHVFLSAYAAMTRPRTLRIKEASLPLVPELSGQIQSCPYFTNWDGSRIYSMAPVCSGGAWHLVPYEFDHVVLLQPNHGGSSHLAPLRWDQVFPVAMEQCFLPTSNQGRALAFLLDRLRRARGWRLSNGDLDEAILALKALG